METTVFQVWMRVTMKAPLLVSVPTNSHITKYLWITYAGHPEYIVEHESSVIHTPIRRSYQQPKGTCKSSVFTNWVEHTYSLVSKYAIFCVNTVSYTMSVCTLVLYSAQLFWLWPLKHPLAFLYCRSLAFLYCRLLLLYMNSRCSYKYC